MNVTPKCTNFFRCCVKSMKPKCNDPYLKCPHPKTNDQSVIISLLMFLNSARHLNAVLIFVLFRRSSGS